MGFRMRKSIKLAHAGRLLEPGLRSGRIDLYHHLAAALEGKLDQSFHGSSISGHRFWLRKPSYSYGAAAPRADRFR